MTALPNTVQNSTLLNSPLQPLSVSSKHELQCFNICKPCTDPMISRYFLDETKDLRFRRNAVKAILGPMLRQVPQGHVLAFYESHITTIMDILKAEVASHQLDIPLDTIEEKTCCYNILFFT